MKEKKLDQPAGNRETVPYCSGRGSGVRKAYMTKENKLYQKGRVENLVTSFHPFSVTAGESEK